MDADVFATKGNLVKARNTLKLSKQGYDMMDRKRNILIRELMTLIADAKDVQEEIKETFKQAYAALRKANIEMGLSNVAQIALAVPPTEGLTIRNTSVMGVVLPLVQYENKSDVPPYSFYQTTSSLDQAYIQFAKVKELVLRMAGIENSAYRLAVSIKKTQKRANSLKNIIIPKYEKISVDIANQLEEKDREEFGRLKVIKSRT